MLEANEQAYVHSAQSASKGAPSVNAPINNAQANVKGHRRARRPVPARRRAPEAWR